MRAILLSVLLAGCELVPAPKQTPATAPTAEGSAVAHPVAPMPQPGNTPPPGSLPQPPPPPNAVNQPAPPRTPCEAAGMRVATIKINEAKDPQERAQLEQERANIVKRTEDGCVQQQWSESLVNCVTAAANAEALGVCLKQLPGTAPKPNPTPSHPVPGAPAAPADTPAEKPAQKLPGKPTFDKPAKPKARRAHAAAGN